MRDVLRFPGALLTFGRGAVTTVAGNLSLAALALALALSLWLYVTDRENPQERQTFNSAIPIAPSNVPNGFAVANVSQTTVRIRIEAPRTELDGLSADVFEATLDLGGLSAGTTNVPVGVRSANNDIRIVEVTPSQVDVTIEPLRTKDVPVRVRLVGSPQTGFAASGERADPERATVSGPESLVALTESVVAEVSLTSLRVDIADERVELEPRDARDGQISRVTVNPEAARVSVDINQTEYSLEFAVTPQVTGQPAPGYNVAGISIEPRLVVVTGPLEVLQSIDAVRGIGTAEISIADARDDVVRTVSLVLPEGASVQGSNEVRVTIDIAPARGEFSFRLTPQVRNVGDGLVVSGAEAVTITLAGDVPVLEGVTTQAIIATVDAGGLGAGVYRLPVEVTAPPGTTVARIEPAEMGLALTSRE